MTAVRISGLIPQLRTTALETGDARAAAELTSRGVVLVRDVHDTPWGTRESVVKDDQGHTIYFGQPLS